MFIIQWQKRLEKKIHMLEQERDRLIENNVEKERDIASEYCQKIQAEKDRLLAMEAEVPNNTPTT